MNKTLYDGTALLAPLDAREFLRSHGKSLTEVLHVIAGDRGIDLFCAADCLLDSLSPDPARVGQAIREIRDLLSEAGIPEDRYAASLRWHGARLTDLAARLPQ